MRYPAIPDIEIGVDNQALILDRVWTGRKATCTARSNGSSISEYLNDFVT